MIRTPRNRFIVSFLLAALMAIAIGCAHTRGSSESSTPPPPPTPYQQVLASNAVLAEANKDLAKAVIAERDAQIIALNDAHDILSVQYRIAKLDKRLSAILAKGPDAARLDAGAIRSILGEIQLLGNDPAVNLNTTAKNRMASIINLTNTLLIGLHEAGVL